MTPCRRLRKSRLACVPNSSTSPQRRRGCCRPTSSGSMISAASVSPASELATQNSRQGCRRAFRFRARLPGLSSIRRMFTSMPTAAWSRDQRNGQDHQPEGLVPGAAGVPGGGVLGHPAVDDGGELFDAGYLWKQPVLLERRRLVQGIVRCVGDRHRDGCLALDQPGRAVVLRRPEIHTGRLLSGGADRRRLALGGFHRDPVAEDESRTADRGAAAVHGQFHDLYRAVRGDRRRSGELDHLRLHRTRQDRARAIRPRQGGRAVAGLQPDHHHRLLGVLYRHDQCRRRSPAQQGSRMMHSIPGRRVILALFLIFLLLPIYWLVNMSFKTNGEIVSTMTLWPHQPTIANYMRIFTDVSWYSGYINSLKYVVINTIIAISVALPAAYAFSRYRFLGDKHLFFWLLSNRMAPAAVYALPFFNLYSAINLFDTPWAVALAHCIFNVPLAVWILEGFVSGVPREIDETAFLDGYSFPRFFIKILVPLIASGIGVAAFFCFMFSWVELLLARTLTSVEAKPISAVMTRTVSAAGMDWGLLAAAGVLTIIPGALVIWFVRNYIARGFALGRV